MLRSSLICFAVAGVFWFGGAKGQTVTIVILPLGIVLLLAYLWMRKR